MSTAQLPAGDVSVVDPELTIMMEAVFAEYRKHHAAPAPGSRITVDRALWQQLDSLGLARLTGRECDGGSGAGWFDSAELLAAAARHGVRLPLAEHDLLANWLLAELGQPIDNFLRTVHLGYVPEAATTPVPWGAEVDRIVVVWRSGETYLVADVDKADVAIERGSNLIGEPRDIVTTDITTFDGHHASAELIEQLTRKAGLIRAIQVCAVLDAAIASSIEHVISREQFGRPLAKFQTIQNLISDAAAEAALARAATEAALTAAIHTDWRADRLPFLIAAARSCVGHAASIVTRNAHQVHGAIGTTYEHHLHEYTRAALAWRSEYGSVQLWDERVAALAAVAGEDGLWALIADNGYC